MYIMLTKEWHSVYPPVWSWPDNMLAGFEGQGPSELDSMLSGQCDAWSVVYTVARYQCVFDCFSPPSLLLSPPSWRAEAAGREKPTETDVTSNERLWWSSWFKICMQLPRVVNTLVIYLHHENEFPHSICNLLIKLHGWKIGKSTININTYTCILASPLLFTYLPSFRNWVNICPTFGLGQHDGHAHEHRVSLHRVHYVWLIFSVIHSGHSISITNNQQTKFSNVQMGATILSPTMIPLPSCGCP